PRTPATPSNVPATSERSTVTSWLYLIPVTLLALFAYGAFCFFAPDRVSVTRPSPGAATSQSADSTSPLASDPAYQSRSPDENEYLDLAVSLADWNELKLPTGEIAKRMPLYPAMLSIIYATQAREHWYSSALILQFLLACVNVILIALIAARLAGPIAGLTAGLIAALYAPFIYLQTLFLTETLLNTFLFLAVLIYVTASAAGPRQPKTWIALLSVSALLGLAALTRANAILFLVPFALHALSQFAGSRDKSLSLAALLVPASLVLAPWMVRNHRELGAYSLSTIGGLNFYLGHNLDYAENPGLDAADYDRFNRLRHEQGLTELDADRRLYAQGWRFIRENPAEALRNCFTKIRTWFTPTIPSYGPLLLLLLAFIRAGYIWTRRLPPPVQRRVGQPYRPTFSARCWRKMETIALIGMAMTYYLHLVSDSPRKIPLISPSLVVLLGVPAILFLWTRFPARSLFLGLIAAQLTVAVVFIPLSRLRWTIDAFFIIAIGIALARTCEMFHRMQRNEPQGTP
ncbi:MAG TPA: glycosyltransferase family 39 protein, partial [Phycisphaerae bacterium]|nr:glycosyltransferase family 39 protein [Phycisphaerae bacterium]